LFSVETVLSRMSDETAKEKIGVEGRVDLFTVEEPAPNKNPCDFPKPFFPILQMMDDAEIKDGIHAGVRVREVLRVGNEEEGKTSCGPVESFLCELDHQRIDIQAIYPAGMKGVLNEFHPFASAAADLKTKGACRKRSHLHKKGDLSSLDPGARRAVDPDSFRPVDFHSFELSLS